jgi:hypothetical protein
MAISKFHGPSTVFEPPSDQDRSETVEDLLINTYRNHKPDVMNLTLSDFDTEKSVSEA